MTAPIECAPILSSVELVQHCDLITVKNGEAVTTSLNIADGTQVQHKNVLELVRAYYSDLVEFGLVAFETRARTEGKHGGGDVEYAVLNEQQASLVLTYMKNTAIVRAFKKQMVKDFWRMRKQIQAAVDPLAHIPPEHRALVTLLCETAQIKASQAQQQAVQISHADSIKRIEARQSASEQGIGFFTVIAYGKLRDIKFSLTDAAALGKRATALSGKAGIAIDKVRDMRFGEVNSYHESMLDAALLEMHGGM